MCAILEGHQHAAVLQGHQHAGEIEIMNVRRWLVQEIVVYGIRTKTIDPRLRDVKTNQALLATVFTYTTLPAEFCATENICTARPADCAL